MRRWRNVNLDVSCDIELALMANHVQVNNQQRGCVRGLTDEMVSVCVGCRVFLMKNFFHSEVRV